LSIHGRRSRSSCVVSFVDPPAGQAPTDLTRLTIAAAVIVLARCAIHQIAASFVGISQRTAKSHAFNTFLPHGWPKAGSL
jgi:hypothetical protein